MDKKKTILITSVSTDIGCETALCYVNMGWNVAATVRSVDLIKSLDFHEDIVIMEFDVKDYNNIKAAVMETMNRFGEINVLIILPDSL